MKKILLFATVAILAISCQKEPIGETVAKAVSGEWSVKYDAMDDSGELIADDLNGGYSRVLTFNTADSALDSIFIADENNFLGFQTKIPCDFAQKSFGTEEVLENLYGNNGYHGPEIIIRNGKIIEGAAHTPSGMPADSIYFELIFVGGDYLQSAFGIDIPYYAVSGFRFTGLEGDQDGF